VVETAVAVVENAVAKRQTVVSETAVVENAAET
jgi:hypothetical protein